MTPEHIIIGTTTRGLSSNVPVTVDPVARARHTVIFGQTGTGKSVLLRNICAQIAAQRGGFAFLDPHGENAEAIVSLIPSDRADEFVYIDLSNNDSLSASTFWRACRPTGAEPPPRMLWRRSCISLVRRPSATDPKKFSETRSWP